jgi:magnesium transporter
MLVKASLYSSGQKVRDINMEEIISAPFDDDHFFWAAMYEPTPEEIQKIFSKVKVHELALEDLAHGNQIPKVEEYDENIFTVLKQVEIDKATGDLKIGEVYLFAGANYVISIRKGVGKNFTYTRHIVEKKPSLLKHGSGYVLYSIMDSVVDRYFPIISAMETELADLENQMFDNTKALENKREVIEGLHKLKGKIRELNNCMLPLMDATSRLFGGRVPDICESLDDYFRDVHDHLVRLTTKLDTLGDSANSSIQTCVAILTIEDNKVTKSLAAWAAIFAVVTFMAGIWGMNFAHMPEINWKFGYPMALSLMVAAACGLRYRFKKMGWLQ